MLLGFMKKKEESDDAGFESAVDSAEVDIVSSDHKAELIRRDEELRAINDVSGSFALFIDADVSDEDLAWRVARAHHDMAEETVGDDGKREQLLRDGLAIAEAAKATGSGYALKWYAILLGRLGDFLPTKEKVANSFKIKEALEAAAELLPDDSSVQTALGQWAYKVAGISWVERNAAKLLFGSPPESSYDEALGFMLASFEMRPSKKAALFAGLCHVQLKQREEATRWLKECLALESAGEADADVDRQASAALAKL